MIVTRLEIDNFRSVERVRFFPKPGLNVMVGETNVGKSAIFLAMSRLLGGSFAEIDLRYGSLQPGLHVACTLELNDRDRYEQFGQLVKGVVEGDKEKFVRRRLEELGKEVLLSCEWDQAEQRAWMQIGPLFLKDNYAAAQIPAGGSQRQWSDFLRELVGRGEPLPDILRRSAVWEASGIQNNAMAFLRARFRAFAETRLRPTGGRSGVLESFAGMDTANVLLNLRMHHQRSESQKYKSICREFSAFFPHLSVEAVEQSPASGQPLIQVMENLRQWPVPVDQVGAGVAEVLTFITNLIGREGQVLVVEEPELHLHPQAKRRLMKLIKESANLNQVFVITHDPLFVDSDQLHGIVRVWMTDQGTQLAGVPVGLTAKEREQLKGSLADPAKREMVFARAVLLVEGESEQRAVREFANKLGCDLDGSGVSVVSYDGEDDWKRYVTLVNSLQIPFICHRDKPWIGVQADDINRFRSSQGELEEVFEKSSLGSLMEQGRREVGTAKPRVAEYVAQRASARDVPPFYEKLIRDIIDFAQRTSVSTQSRASAEETNGHSSHQPA